MNQTNWYLAQQAQHLNDITMEIYKSQMRSELSHLQSMLEYFNVGKEKTSSGSPHVPDIPRGGGDLVSNLPGCVCRKVKDMGPFSLKMGVKFATSLNMGGKLPPKLYIIT